MGKEKSVVAGRVVVKIPIIQVVQIGYMPVNALPAAKSVTSVTLVVIAWHNAWTNNVLATTNIPTTLRGIGSHMDILAPLERVSTKFG